MKNDKSQFVVRTSDFYLSLVICHLTEKSSPGCKGFFFAKSSRSWRSSRLRGESWAGLSPRRREAREENAKDFSLVAALLLCENGLSWHGRPRPCKVGPNLGHGRDGHATKRRSLAFDETIFEEITGQPKSVQLGSGNMIEEPAGRLGCGTAPKSQTVIVEPWLAVCVGRQRTMWR